MRNGENLVEMHKAMAPDDNIYEERLDIVVGAAANDNELQGPISASTVIDLPLDSRDNDATQKYIVGGGLLQVHLNGQVLTLGEDWDEVGGTGCESSKIEILQDLVVDDFLSFRIDSQGSVFFASAAGVSGTLQEAYDNGRTVTTNAGQPIVITGPGGEKLLRILGDLEVTGVIDPTGLELTPVASNPLDGFGIWTDSANNDLVYEGNALRATSLKLGPGETELDETTLQTLISGPGGSWTTSTVVGAGPHAVDDLDEVFVDTSGAPAVVNLPVGAKGKRIRLVDEAGTWFANNVTVNGDGADTFDGVAGPLTLNIDDRIVELLGDDNNWRVIVLK